MYQFGVEVRQEDNGRLVAFLVDLPDGPRGSGATAAEAYNDLIVVAADAMNEFLQAGRLPRALADGNMACVGIGMPTRMEAVAPSGAPSTFVGRRDKGKTWTYSWRNNTTMTEG